MLKVVVTVQSYLLTNLLIYLGLLNCIVIIIIILVVVVESHSALSAIAHLVYIDDLKCFVNVR